MVSFVNLFLKHLNILRRLTLFSYYKVNTVSFIFLLDLCFVVSKCSYLYKLNNTEIIDPIEFGLVKIERIYRRKHKSAYGWDTGIYF